MNPNNPNSSNNPPSNAPGAASQASGSPPLRNPNTVPLPAVTVPLPAAQVAPAGQSATPSSTGAGNTNTTAATSGGASGDVLIGHRTLLEEFRRDYEKALQTSQNLDQNILGLLGAFGLVFSLVGVIQLNTLPGVLEKVDWPWPLVIWGILAGALILFVYAIYVILFGKVGNLGAPGSTELGVDREEYESTPIPLEWDGVESTYLNPQTEVEILDKLHGEYWSLLVDYKIHNRVKREKLRLVTFLFFIIIVLMAGVITPISVWVQASNSGARTPTPIPVYVVATYTQAPSPTPTLTHVPVSTSTLPILATHPPTIAGVPTTLPSISPAQQSPTPLVSPTPTR